MAEPKPCPSAIVQCKQCLAITNAANGCAEDGCPVAPAPAVLPLLPEDRPKRVHLAKTGDQLTEPGWYWDATAQEFLKIESITQTVYQPGILRSTYPQHIAGEVKSLLCRGSTHHGDWGGPFVGPLTLANIEPPKEAP